MIELIQLWQGKREVTYLNKSLPDFAAAANTVSDPIEFPNNTEPSLANSSAKSEPKRTFNSSLVTLTWQHMTCSFRKQNQKTFFHIQLE